MDYITSILCGDSWTLLPSISWTYSIRKVQLRAIHQRTEHISATIPGHIDRCYMNEFFKSFHTYSMQKIFNNVICLWANKAHFRSKLSGNRKFLFLFLFYFWVVWIMNLIEFVLTTQVLFDKIGLHHWSKFSNFEFLSLRGLSNISIQSSLDFQKSSNKGTCIWTSGKNRNQTCIIFS